TLRGASLCAADRQHLLVAARPIGAAAGAALLEPREHFPDALDRPALGRAEAGQHQVLLDVETAEDAAILVDQLHSCARDRVALLAGDVLAVEHDLAAARRHHAHQALERRALAGAVAAE